MENKQEIKREFGLSSLAVDNRTSIVILTLIIAIMGVYSYITLPKENFPEIVIPTVYVGTPYSGNSPVDIENLVTRPIEKEIKSVTGVKNIKSTSIQDYSTIVVEFNPDVQISKALQDVKDAVDKAKSELPNDLDADPNVFEVNLSDLPIMYINLSGDYSIDELKGFAEYLEDEIEKLPEISKAEIKGALEREIQVNADIHKMEARQVSFSDISNAISAENLTLSGGNILANEVRRSLRVIGEFKDPRELEDVIIKTENNRIVYLKDVADVVDTYKERNSYARESRLPVVTVNAVKRNGANLLDASDKIKTILEKAQKNRFPSDLKITISNDQSKITRDQVSNLENSIISGVILVVLVLMFFLGLRNALFVGVAIPLSMFMAFAILSALGITLNLVVLFSLILALGMLVDNGIVVVENIYRLMQEGKSSIQAAKEGVGEVALPIITSTATTLAAFLPLAFWDGIIGEFMGYLPITLIIVLSSSLFVALVINPVLTAMFMKIQQHVKPNKLKWNIIAIILLVMAVLSFIAGQNAIGSLLALFAVLIPFNIYLLASAVQWFQEVLLSRLEAFYERTLLRALRGKAPYMYFFGTILLLIGSIVLLGLSAPKVNFFPVNEPNNINIFIQKPIGTDVEVTNSFTEKLETAILDYLKPYERAVESVVAQVGKGASDPTEGPSMGDSPNKARIAIGFVEYQFRDGVSTKQILEDIRAMVDNYAGVQITADKDRAGPPVGKPINIEISGEDYDMLISLTNRIKNAIDDAGIKGIEELKTDLELGKPELIVNIDRDKARRFGLSTYTIATELRTALFGQEVSKFKEGEDEHPIQLRLKVEYRNDPNALMNQKVTFRDKFGKLKQVPISSVADVSYSSSYGSVKRIDLDRVITLYSNVKEGFNPTEINNQIKALIRDMDIPDSYTVKFTGEQEEQAESSAFLMRALIIAVLSILLIIVAQFNSITTPLIIMGSVLFSTIGVFLGLVIFNMEFIIVMTGVGIISLAGVVVNNAIVLIDYTNLVRKRKRLELGIAEDEILSKVDLHASIVEAGKTRLRPVLLTAITTVLGLIPLAIGLNINFSTLLSDFDPQIFVGGDNAIFWGPMAWTVIFGLVFATFLTLILVPVMYLLVDKLKFRMNRAS